MSDKKDTRNINKHSQKRRLKRSEAASNTYVALASRVLS